MLMKIWMLIHYKSLADDHQWAGQRGGPNRGNFLLWSQVNSAHLSWTAHLKRRFADKHTHVLSHTHTTVVSVIILSYTRFGCCCC